MKKEFILTCFLFFIVIMLLIASVDLNSVTVRVFLNVTSTIGGAIIGGIVAFYVAKMQINANMGIEKSKERRIENNICLLVIIDLEDMIKRFYVILEQTDDKGDIPLKSLKQSIILDALIKFKNEFIYLIKNESDIKNYSSVVNRLLFLTTGDNEYLEKEKLEKLIQSCESVKGLMVYLLDSRNN